MSSKYTSNTMITKYLCSTILLILTVGHNAASANRSQVYFGTDRGGQGIYHAQFESTIGTLSSITLAVAVEFPSFLATHPNQQFLYATTGSDAPYSANVAAFRSQADGSLTFLNKQPTLGSNACHLSVDATGRTLVAANYGSGNVSSFQIRADGTLTAVVSNHYHGGSAQDPKRQKEPHPHSAFIHPNNCYVYVPDLGIDKVMIYALDPVRATLTPCGSTEVPGGSQGPRHMKFSSDGKFAYVLNELSLSIASYSVNLETGQLEYIDTQSVLTNGVDPEGMSCAEIRIHPSEQWLYASIRDLAGRGRDALSTFQRATDGSIRLIANTPAAVYIPRNFNIDPSGKWLIVGGQRSATLTIFSIHQDTGTLTLKSAEIPFEGQPMCVEFLQ